MTDRMTTIAGGLWRFWNQFGVPAYPQDAVPDDVDLPYITYRLGFPDWRSQMSIFATVWSRSTSYAECSALVDEIDETIGECFQIPTESGVLMVYKDINFAQVQPQDDISIKAVFLSLILEADV